MMEKLSFQDINQIRLVLKMQFSYYSWFCGAFVSLDENSEYCINVLVSDKVDKVLIPNNKNGVKIHTVSYY